ncbi:hypothetical protein [Hymenobacter koreensis]|uniref:Uncharacterized protein n=1 Tax=Hymenobacter koreensis TaxID=1084523 RepID=A0ABP8JJS9_9BACT
MHEFTEPGQVLANGAIKMPAEYHAHFYETGHYCPWPATWITPRYASLHRGVQITEPGYYIKRGDCVKTASEVAERLASSALENDEYAFSLKWAEILGIADLFQQKYNDSKISEK